MTALGKAAHGLQTFASDVAQGFFEITHNGMAVLGLLVALLPSVGQNLLAPHADTYPGEPGHLTLWAGVTPTLVLTLLVLTVGLAAFRWRRPIERLQAAISRAPDADRLYRRMMR